MLLSLLYEYMIVYGEVFFMMCLNLCRQIFCSGCGLMLEFVCMWLNFWLFVVKCLSEVLMFCDWMLWMDVVLSIFDMIGFLEKYLKLWLYNGECLMLMLGLSMMVMFLMVVFMLIVVFMCLMIFGFYDELMLIVGGKQVVGMLEVRLRWLVVLDCLWSLCGLLVIIIEGMLMWLIVFVVQKFVLLVSVVFFLRVRLEVEFLVMVVFLWVMLMFL